jgi:NADPH2 dehydrogenase
MPTGPFQRIATIKSVTEFRSYAQSLGAELPCDDAVEDGPNAPLARPVRAGELPIGNRFAIHPMEGWDGTADGRPTERTTRRWHRFGLSGAKLIWGGEAVAVRHDGRANPGQLLMSDANKKPLAGLRETLLEGHRQQCGATDDLVIGLQLTHSGRFSRPEGDGKLRPRIACAHPILDGKFHVDPAAALLSDDELRRIIDCFIDAAATAAEIGFQFVDVKHCHGYLGHELLGAHTRPGDFGGSFENRTRFLREVVAGIRARVPGLHVGVRLSAFDMPPFRPDPKKTQGKRLGPGIPEAYEEHLPYRYGFGLDVDDPLKPDLTETIRFLELLQSLDIRLVNLTAGSPYYTPHIQRPALYPPSDGYQPPEDPLVGVARQMAVVRRLKSRFPELLFVGTGYSYLQEYLPHVAQAAVRDGWVDCVGLGRMVLSYPELPHDVLNAKPLQTKILCRTFSDCTTAPRNGLVSGCFPLDAYYKKSEEGVKLRKVKAGERP